MLPAALHQISVCMVLCIAGLLGNPIPFYSSLEGSTDEEEHAHDNSSASSQISFTVFPTLPSDSNQGEADFLKQVVNFLEENMLLILVVTTLLFLVFLIICGAISMSRRRKVNAYYPSSFPSKMYVDHQDKTGGPKPFNEVQDKAASEQQSECVDSHKQLQADIMRVAKNLRTPTKSDAPKESCQKEEQSPESADGCIQEEQREISDSQSEAEPPQQQEKEEGSEETSKSLRPSSLHIHSDSATLQLIAGEKTAF